MSSEDTKDIVAAILAAGAVAQSGEPLDPAALVARYRAIKEEIEKAEKASGPQPTSAKAMKRLGELSAKGPGRNRFARNR